MSAKHTQGDWSLPHFVTNPEGRCQCGYVLSEGYFGAIATVHFSTKPGCEDGDNPPLEEAKANARLIHAAPKLLAALKEMRNWYKAEYQSNERIDKLADNAIALAEPQL